MQEGRKQCPTFALRSMSRACRNIFSILSANPAESGTTYPDLSVAVSNITIARSFAVSSSELA